MGDWQQAELEYVAFIENYRESPDVTTAKLLARIIPKLGDEAREHLYKKFPDDLVKAAVQLSKEEQDKLYDRFSGLRKRVKEAEEKQLKPESTQP